MELLLDIVIQLALNIADVVLEHVKILFGEFLALEALLADIVVFDFKPGFVALLAVWDLFLADVAGY